MNAIYFIVFVLFDLAILIVVAFVIVKSKKKRSQSLLDNARSAFPQLQVELNTESKDLFSACRVILRHPDCNISITEYPGTKNSPPSTLLSISTNYPLSFNIRRETGLEKFGKKFNLLSEFQIGELELDRQLYIKVDNQTQARNYFMQNEVLNSLKKIVQLPGFLSLACEPLAKSGNTNANLAEHRELKALDFLAEVTQHIPNKWEQTTRYYGVYSARYRGANKSKSKSSTIAGQDLVPKESSAKPSSHWAKCMKQVFELDPLECPKCGSQMKIKSFPQSPKEIEALCKSLKIESWIPPPKFVMHKAA